ncbi:MAG: hypothetical protein FJZ90_13235, partial [Chloroflexi bacterium]|nr:hypothetical protein [Chloroflexota bacterium]
MIAFLRHCLAASYLFSQEMTPLRTWSAAETRGAVLLVPGMLLAWRWGASLRASGRAPLPAWITGLGFLATLLLLAVRFQVRGPLSPRIWWLSSVAVGLLTPPIYWLSRRPLGPGMRAVGRALACRLGAADPLLSPLWQLGLTAAHLGGLLLLSRRPELGAWPWLSAGAALGAAALGEPGAGSTASWRARFRPELLSPLFMPYLAGLLHGLVAQRLGVDVAPYGAFPYPNLWSPWFDLR